MHQVAVIIGLMLVLVAIHAKRKPEAFVKWGKFRPYAFRAYLVVGILWVLLGLILGGAPEPTTSAASKPAAKPAEAAPAAASSPSLGPEFKMSMRGRNKLAPNSFACRTKRALAEARQYAAQNDTRALQQLMADDACIVAGRGGAALYIVDSSGWDDWAEVRPEGSRETAFVSLSDLVAVDDAATAPAAQMPTTDKPWRAPGVDYGDQPKAAGN